MMMVTEYSDWYSSDTFTASLSRNQNWLIQIFYQEEFGKMLRYDLCNNDATYQPDDSELSL